MLSLNQASQPGLPTDITWGAFKTTAAWVPLPKSLLSELVWRKAKVCIFKEFPPTQPWLTNSQAWEPTVLEAFLRNIL